MAALLHKKNNKSDHLKSTRSAPLNGQKQMLHLTEEKFDYLVRKLDGKLLRRNEIDVADELFTKFVQRKWLQKEHGIVRSWYGIRCNRCNNRSKKRFATFSCEKCKRIHYYCRNCIHMGRISECEGLYRWQSIRYSWPKHSAPLTWKGKLTPQQERAATQIIGTIKNCHELLIWAVTGSGKTEMLFPGIAYALKRGKRVCIATPRADVVRELLPRVQAAFANIPVQGLYAGSPDKDGTAQLIIATTHQLLRFVDAFDVLVIDEIDAFPYHQDKTLSFAAHRAAKKHVAKIYLTATPRHKERYLMNTQKLPYCFVPLRYHRHLLPLPTFIYTRKLKSLLEQHRLPPVFTSWLLQREKRERQILLFVPTISLAEALREIVAATLSSAYGKSFRVAAVHAEDPAREEKISLFRKRQIYLLITTTILERGVTFPAIDVVVLDAGHVVFDAAALVQIAGRAGRDAKDPTGEVIFIHDGKTDAMEKARNDIVLMNERAKRLLKGKESI